MKKILLFVLVSLLLTGCWENNDKNADTLSGSAQVSDKKEFVVEVKKVEAFSGDVSIEKLGKIVGSQDIVVKAQASGKVKLLSVEEGEIVEKGWKILELDDTVGSYDLNLKRSKNSLDSIKLDYKSSELTLTKAIKDAEIALEKAEHNLYIAKKDIEEKVENAKNDFDNSNLDLDNSKADLSYEKIKNDLKKSVLDYENSIKSDNETLLKFRQNLMVEKFSIINKIDTVIHEAKDMLGLESNENSGNPAFAGVLSTLQSLGKTKNDIENTSLPVNYTNNEILDLIKKYETAYVGINGVLDLIEKTLKNGTLSYDVLPVNDDLYEDFKIQHNNVIIQLSNTIHEVDKLLGATEQNKTYNDSFERYLSAKNSNLKSDADKLLFDVIKFKNDMANTDISSNKLENVLSTVENIAKGYDMMTTLLGKTDDMLKNSVVAEDFTQTTIDGHISTISSQKNTVQTNYKSFISFKNQFDEIINNYISTIDSLQVAMQSSYNSFVSMKNTINAFLSVYKDLQESKKKNIEILGQNATIAEKDYEISKNTTEIGYNRTLLEGEDKTKQAELNIKTAKNNLENAKKNKIITLQKLNNSIEKAEIQKQESSKEYMKLIPTAPINGRINKIFVDVGEELSIGTPLFSIVSNLEQEVIISLNSDELKYVNLDQKVLLTYKGYDLNGNIVSIGNIADDNLNYTAKIHVDSPVSVIGDFVKTYISFNQNSLIVPINITNVTQGSQGYLYTLTSNHTVEKVNVRFGQVWGNKIEILTQLAPNTQIIVSDMQNYDEKKHVINSGD